MKKLTLSAVALSAALFLTPVIASAAPSQFVSVNNTLAITNVAIAGVAQEFTKTPPGGKTPVIWPLVRIACHAVDPCIATVIIDISATNPSGTNLKQTMSMALETGIVTPASISEQVGNKLYGVKVTYDLGYPVSTITCTDVSTTPHSPC